VRAALNLGDHFGKPLYELIPDLIPYDKLADVEIQLWGKHYEEKRQRKQ